MALALALYPAGAGALGSDDICAAVSHASLERGAHLVYVKAEHTLCLFDGGVLVWRGSASHGREAGKKQFANDLRTPEGRYTLSPARKSRTFGLFLRVSYPNEQDRRFARAAGKPPGGAIGIHGPQRWYAFLGAAQSWIDHSEGCIVVDAAALRELARRIRTPCRLEILPALLPLGALAS
jgi:murein L,D-transpeptidase YafK